MIHHIYLDLLSLKKKKKLRKKKNKKKKTNGDTGKNENLVVRRYGKRNKELHLNSSPQDLFVTQKEDILVLLPYIADFKEKEFLIHVVERELLGRF